MLKLDYRMVKLPETTHPLTFDIFLSAILLQSLYDFCESRVLEHAFLKQLYVILACSRSFLSFFDNAC